MGNNYLNTEFIDKAILFATKAHANTERRAKGTPYILHPLEAASIVASMTNDPDLIAAAILHDTIEDCGVTKEEIAKEFNERVASIVSEESDHVSGDEDEAKTWAERKLKGLEILRKSSINRKMVALGDKLSNMRAIASDFRVLGDRLWDRFHNNNPLDHARRYIAISYALVELENFDAYKEFVSLVDEVFSKAGKLDNRFEKKGNVISFQGLFSCEFKRAFKDLDKETTYRLDFDGIYDVSYNGLRLLFNLYHEGYKFYIVNTSKQVFLSFATSDMNVLFPVSQRFKEIDPRRINESGSSYSAVSYYFDDNDTMCKLYKPMFDDEKSIREKRNANHIVKMGIPAPICGDLISVKGAKGICFERIMNKRSISRALNEEPDKYLDFAKILAKETKLLHQTPCDTNCFEDYKIGLKNCIDKLRTVRDFSSEEYDKMTKVLFDLPNEFTCVHGDFHCGNTLFDENDNLLFIDFSDFGYGSPYFDLGTFYVVAYTDNTEMTEELYHISRDLMVKFYEAFLRCYFDTDDEGILKEELRKIRKFAAFTAIRFASYENRFRPYFAKLIKEELL